MRRSVFPAQQEKTMKPNGKMFPVRVLLFTVCAVCLLSDLSRAQTVRGTFKLSVTAHWGNAVLAPGEYEFVVDTASVTRVVTVTSKSTGWSGMILASCVDNARMAGASRMTLANSDGAKYVKTLYLNDAGAALGFSVPKAMAKLAKAPSPTVTSPSGAN
jgi:hypothetical protein